LTCGIHCSGHHTGRTLRSGPLLPTVVPNQIGVGSLPTHATATDPPSVGILCVARVSSSPMSNAGPPYTGCVYTPHSSSSPASVPHSTRVVDNQGAPPVVATIPTQPLLTSSVLWCWSSLLLTHGAATTPPSAGHLCAVRTSSSPSPAPYAGPPYTGCLFVPHSSYSPAPVLPDPVLPHQALMLASGLKRVAQSSIVLGDHINPTTVVLRHLGTHRRCARCRERSEVTAHLTYSPSR
jgi:hypothetical protein